MPKTQAAIFDRRYRRGKQPGQLRLNASAVFLSPVELVREIENLCDELAQSKNKAVGWYHIARRRILNFKRLVAISTNAATTRGKHGNTVRSNKHRRRIPHK